MGLGGLGDRSSEILDLLEMMWINVGFMTCGDRCEVFMFGKVIFFVTVLLSYVVLRLLCCMFLGYVVLCYSMS